jgi:hypothetical protein
MGVESWTPFTALAVDVDHHFIKGQGEGYAREMWSGFDASCQVPEGLL